MVDQDTGQRIEELVGGLSSENFVDRLTQLLVIFAEPANWHHYFRAEPAIWLQYRYVLTDDLAQNQRFREAYLGLGEFLLPAYKSLRQPAA
jgi:hypothetical protein